jgi:hypothetical protein
MIMPKISVAIVKKISHTISQLDSIVSQLNPAHTSATSFGVQQNALKF